ncbi:PucR family transcriptional regulator [Brachybacterium ginsengisoli]|uniref:PucR family transcriptional regulator n=1 Tax=Brachybacterium ginsengisoli TaxID=1331682 RepID=UPI001472A842|nr:PucR family transcriptional regulator [Brachybacterium ginsengisoli]
MVMSVRELMEIPHLTLRLHAGAAGLDRTITWTHTTDLPEPWRWLSHGELMMTNGMSFPAGAAEQVELLDRLSDVGVGALAIGEEMYCPPLTRDFDDAADRLGIPVLWIRYPMPFAAISRTVAESVQPEQSLRISRTARLYEAIRRTPGTDIDRSHTRRTLISVLGSDVDVCDVHSGRAYFPHDDQPPEEVTRAIRGPVGLLSSGNRLAPLSGGRVLHIVPVPTQSAAVLAVISRSETPPDTLLLQHAATVAALELSQAHLELGNRQRIHGELAAAVLDAGARRQGAARELGEIGLDPARSLVAAVACEDEERLRMLPVSLWRARIPYAMTLRAGSPVLILPQRPHALRVLTDALGRTGRTGLSRPVRRGSRYAECAQEAAWALGMARRSGSTSVRYGSMSPDLGPTDRADARALVEHRLGPVLRHDAEQDGSLMETLEAFLEHRRSWQRTAEALQLHRQTVHYRIRRIEGLLDVDLHESGDLAQVWLALQARRSLDGMS